MNALAMPIKSNEYPRIVDLSDAKKYNKNLLDNSEMSIYRKAFLELTDEEMDTIQKLIDGNE